MFHQYGNKGVSKNSGTPKSSILIGFSIISHPFWGTPIFGNTHKVPLNSRKVYVTPVGAPEDVAHPMISGSAKVTLNAPEIETSLDG